MVVRFAAYAALVAFTFEWLVMAGSHGDPVALVRDDGPLENAQLLLAVFVAGMFAYLAGRIPAQRDLFQIMAGLAYVAGARELDNLTLTMGSRHAYKLIALPGLLYAGAALLRARTRIFDDVRNLARTPAFGLLFVGFLAVVAYGQVFGQKELWMALVAEGNYRPVKDLVEEGTELFGYVLIAIGAIEAWAWSVSSSGE